MKQQRLELKGPNWLGTEIPERSMSTPGGRRKISDGSRNVVLRKHAGINQDKSDIRDQQGFHATESLESLPEFRFVSRLRREMSAIRRVHGRSLLTLFAVSLLRSARSRFQHPLRYSNAVMFSGRPAMTVIISGSSVMTEGESDRRASKSRSVQSACRGGGVGSAGQGRPIVSVSLTRGGQKYDTDKDLRLALLQLRPSGRRLTSLTAPPHRAAEARVTSEFMMICECVRLRSK